MCMYNLPYRALFLFRSVTNRLEVAASSILTDFRTARCTTTRDAGRFVLDVRSRSRVRTKPCMTVAVTCCLWVSRLNAAPDTFVVIVQVAASRQCTRSFTPSTSSAPSASSSSTKARSRRATINPTVTTASSNSTQAPSRHV